MGDERERYAGVAHRRAAIYTWVFLCLLCSAMLCCDLCDALELAVLIHWFSLGCFGMFCIAVFCLAAWCFDLLPSSCSA